MRTRCIPALITPTKSSRPNLDGEINYDVIDELVSYGVQNDVDGVLIAGCTGHAVSLTMDEQVGLIKHVQDNWGDRTEVIAGDGSNVTRDAIEYVKRVEGETGVRTHLQISPYQNKPEQDGIFEHYKSVAEAAEGEVIVYSVPGRTGGKGILSETAAKLAEIENIIGIKEASGDMERIKRTIELTKDLDFFVLSGDDGLTYEIMGAGGEGVISVAANVDPRRVSDMVHDFPANREISKELDCQLKDLYSVLFRESNPQPTHYALSKMGFNVGIPRLPLLPVRDETAEGIDIVLRELGLID